MSTEVRPLEAPLIAFWSAPACRGNRRARERPAMMVFITRDVPEARARSFRIRLRKSPGMREVGRSWVGPLGCGLGMRRPARPRGSSPNLHYSEGITCKDRASAGTLTYSVVPTQR